MSDDESTAGNTAKDREEWLGRALGEFESRVSFPSTHALLPACRVSCGWPKSSRGKRPGYAYPGDRSADGACEIFVSPEVAKPAEALAIAWTLAIDVLRGVIPDKHARLVDCGKLAGAFASSNPNAATPTLDDGAEALAKRFESDMRFLDALAALGPYPHAQFAQQQKPGATRLLKLSHSCGWVCRVSYMQGSKVTDLSTCPACGCNGTWIFDGSPA